MHPPLIWSLLLMKATSYYHIQSITVNQNMKFISYNNKKTFSLKKRINTNCKEQATYIPLEKICIELFCMKGISFKINIYYSRKKWAEHSTMICLALYFIFGLYCLCQYVCYVRTICPTARCRIASKELPHHPPPPLLLFNSVLLLLSIITL